MVFSESVTSKQRFMQSRGVGEKGTVILICLTRHSNRGLSDTSINSPSSTKFTLVFRKAQYFVSSCRISQSYFQSQTCHHGVAVRQLVVIMTIYSSGSEELFSPQFSQPKKNIVFLLPYSSASYCIVFACLSFFHLLVYLATLTCCMSLYLSICLFICLLFILSVWLSLSMATQTGFLKWCYIFPKLKIQKRNGRWKRKSALSLHSTSGLCHNRGVYLKDSVGVDWLAVEILLAEVQSFVSITLLHSLKIFVTFHSHRKIHIMML